MAETTGREPLALFLVEISCWELCRCGFSSTDSITVTFCHGSLPESLTQDLQLADRMLNL